MTMADEFNKAIKPYADAGEWDKVCGVIEEWNDEGKIVLPEDADGIENCEPEAREYANILGVVKEKEVGAYGVEIKEDELDYVRCLVDGDLSCEGVTADVWDNDGEFEDEGCYGYTVPTSAGEVNFLGDEEERGHYIFITKKEAIELCGEEAIDELDEHEGGSQYYIYYTTYLEWTDWADFTFTDGSDNAYEGIEF